MLLGECSKPLSLNYQNFRVAKLSPSTTNEISCSLDGTGTILHYLPVIGNSHWIHSSRYAFRSTEKVALQEIGPRFTLKLRWLKKGIPAVYNYGESAPQLTLGTEPSLEAGEEGEEKPEGSGSQEGALEERPKKTVPPKQDEFIWQWKVGLCLVFICNTLINICSLLA